MVRTGSAVQFRAAAPFSRRNPQFFPNAPITPIGANMQNFARTSPKSGGKVGEGYHLEFASIFSKIATVVKIRIIPLVNRIIMKKTRLPKLPQLLDRKIYKTGQTRGADDDEIYQNRVSRNSTALIPFSVWIKCQSLLSQVDIFENGYIVLIPPSIFFAKDAKDLIEASGLVIGENALVFYETREQWTQYDPTKIGWKPAQQRTTPLNGQYVARISATTAAENGGKIVHGFNSTTNKGAGIRVYEYASSKTIALSRIQLESLVWLCGDSLAVAEENGMTKSDASARRQAVLESGQKENLLDMGLLLKARIINKDNRTVCPLCLEELSAQGFFNKIAQAEGRDVSDLTITQLNLFHIQELRAGVLNHCPYNLGWGHHHCNVVVKDSGIAETLEWMRSVVQRNEERN